MVGAASNSGDIPFSSSGSQYVGQSLPFQVTVHQLGANQITVQGFKAVYCDDSGNCNGADGGDPVCGLNCNNDSILATEPRSNVAQLGTESVFIQWLVNPVTCGSISYSFQLVSTPVGQDQSTASTWFTTSTSAGSMTVTVSPPITAVLGPYSVKIRGALSSNPAFFKEEIVDWQITKCDPKLVLSTGTHQYTIGDPALTINSNPDALYTWTIACGYTYKYNVASANPPVSLQSSFTLSYVSNTRSVLASGSTITYPVEVVESAPFVLPQFKSSTNLILQLLDPCALTNLTPTPSQALSDMVITALKIGSQTQQVGFIEDSVSQAKSTSGSSSYCHERKYYVTSTQLTATTSLPNTALQIDANGEITVDASALGHTYLGTYTVTVKVAFEAYGAVRPTTLTFKLTIDPCVVTDLSLNLPLMSDQTYTIGGAAISWLHGQSFATMTPLCPYTLEFTTQNKPVFIVEQKPSATTIKWTAESLKRSDATKQVMEVIGTVKEQPSASPSMSITDFIQIEVIDPCLTTVISDDVVKELVTFQGYKTVSPTKLAFTDTKSVWITSIHPSIKYFCGPISTDFFCNETYTKVLTAQNFDYITFSPTLNTKPGVAECTLLASMAEVVGITRTIHFYATTMGYIETPIETQNYYTGSQLLIPYARFQIYPANYFTTNDYRLYLVDSMSLLSLPLDLEQLRPLNPAYFTLDKVEQTIRISNGDRNLPDPPKFNVVLAALVNDKYALFTAFKVNLFNVAFSSQQNYPPQWVGNLTNTFVVNQCIANRTVQWSYDLPVIVDMEGDDILTPKIEFDSEDIAYLPKRLKFKQIKFVEQPKNVTVTIVLEDSKGAKDKHEILIQFKCFQSNTTDKVRNTSQLEAISKQKSWPTARILSISVDAKMTIKFNQVMAVPENASEIQNGTILLNETFWPALDIQVIPGFHSKPELLRMNWTFISYSSSQLQVQLIFETPTIVSSIMDSKDSISVTVYGYSWFMDQKGNFIDPGYKLESRLLPRLNTVEAIAEANEQGQAAVAAAATLLSLSTLINFLMAGPLQHILNAIKSSQIITHLLLIDVSSPATASTFFGQLMALLTFAVFDLSDFFDTIFDFDEIDALSDQFDTLGYGSLYVYLNLGNIVITAFFPFIIWIILYFVAKYLYQKWQPYYENLTKKLYFNHIIKFIHETYFLLAMSAAINLHYAYWNSFGNASNMIMSIVIIMVVVAFPVFVGVMYSDKKNLALIRDRERSGKLFMQKYGDIILPYHTHRRGAKVVTALYFEMIRKIWLVCTLVYMQKYALYSLIMVNFQVLMMIFIIAEAEPYHKSSDTNLDLFNEFSTLVVNYHLMLFTEFVPDVDTRERIGTSLIAFTCGNLGVNLGIILRNSLNLFYNTMKLRYGRYKLLKAAKEKSQKTFQVNQELRARAEQAQKEKQEWAELLAQQEQVDAELNSLSSIAECSGEDSERSSVPLQKVDPPIFIPQPYRGLLAQNKFDEIESHMKDNIVADDVQRYLKYRQAEFLQTKKKTAVDEKEEEEKDVRKPGTISRQGMKDLLAELYGPKPQPVFVPLPYRALLEQNKFDEIDLMVSRTIIPDYLKKHIEQKRAEFQLEQQSGLRALPQLNGLVRQLQPQPPIETIPQNQQISQQAAQSEYIPWSQRKKSIFDDRNYD